MITLSPMNMTRKVVSSAENYISDGGFDLGISEWEGGSDTQTWHNNDSMKIVFTGLYNVTSLNDGADYDFEIGETYRIQMDIDTTNATSQDYWFRVLDETALATLKVNYGNNGTFYLDYVAEVASSKIQLTNSGMAVDEFVIIDNVLVIKIS